MEKIEIQYIRAVKHYLNGLVDVLFQEGYFNYEENAHVYVRDLIGAVEESINTQKHKKTPDELMVYGEFYVSYKSTKRTAWYIFFSRMGNRCLVRYITNNHVADAGFLRHL